MRSSWIDSLTRRFRSTTSTESPRGLSLEAATLGLQAAPAPFAAEPWFLDHLNVEDNRVYVFGWSILTDNSTEPPGGWFLINGKPFDELRYPFPRPDIGGVFWMHPGAELSGFEGAAEHLSEVYPDGILQVQRIRSNRRSIESGRDFWCKPDPALHADIPDEAGRFRVIGDRDPHGFLLSGATDYHRIDCTLFALSGRHLHEFANVLDWGVGCGRVARHFPSASAAALTGCDIDKQNVDWCSAHLRGDFVQCTMHPPLPFADGSFDVVYGISVFTHLREAMQLRWLEELSRVLVHGGFVLVTIHGQTAIDFSREPREQFWRLTNSTRQQGIVVTKRNSQLDGHADHDGEYVDVLQTPEYVRRVWGRYFRVEHVLPGYILHHDLVILRKL